MRKKIMLLAALFLCMSAASCSDAPVKPSQSGSIETETVPGTTPETDTNTGTTPETDTNTGTTPETETKPSQNESIKDKFDCITIERALEIATQNGTNPGDKRYYVYGTIKEIKNTEYGEMVITDGKDEILAYGTYSADGKDRYNTLEDKPVKGDEVVLYSTLCTYKKKGQEIKEIKSGWIVAFKHADAQKPDIKPTDPVNPDTKPSNPDVNPPIDHELTPEINAYYATATGTGAILKDNLHEIISVREMTSYDDLWTTYKKVDIREDGKIMDIYSSVTNFRPGSDQSGSYKKEGDSYNREHTIPKSWWGGSKSNQGADPFIVFPSDGYVNNRRSNYSFGEVKSTTYESINGYSKLGSSKYPGASTVFEPADEWKGDMARAYFYATTCYYTDNWRNGDGHFVFTASGNFGLTDYASKLFLKWHFQDPVSEWEIKRNNGIYQINGNRNPYIDHPEFVAQIWGTETF